MINIVKTNSQSAHEGFFVTKYLKV